MANIGTASSDSTIDNSFITDRVRSVLIPPHALGAGSESYSRDGWTAAVLQPDGANGYTYYVWQVPDDFVSLSGVYAIINAQGTGNYYGRVQASAAALGQDTGNTTDIINLSVLGAVTANQMAELDVSAAFDGLSLAKEDIVGCELVRSGADALDTVGNSCYIFGLRIEYTADM